MKKLSFLLLFTLISVSFVELYAQNSIKNIPPEDRIVWIEKNGKDTMLMVYLNEIYIFPPERFKNKNQEKFYYSTVRDVKLTLPYAKLIASELNKTNIKLASISDEKEQKKYLNTYEKEVFKKYEPSLKKMSINQGQMLLKLIDRECAETPYELIKAYRGSISAFFWQGVARLFGSNLKSTYDGADKDKIVERIIILVETNRL
ncbi:MAG: DUF4294 domain-containing protein [Paludibacter sp.]|nr:DUF4294 domain-containing protein [Paludibacter sp.]